MSTDFTALPCKGGPKLKKFEPFMVVCVDSHAWGPFIVLVQRGERWEGLPIGTFADGTPWKMSTATFTGTYNTHLYNPEGNA